MFLDNHENHQLLLYFLAKTLVCLCCNNPCTAKTDKKMPDPEMQKYQKTIRIHSKIGDPRPSNSLAKFTCLVFDLHTLLNTSLSELLKKHLVLIPYPPHCFATIISEHDQKTTSLRPLKLLKTAQALLKTI